MLIPIRLPAAVSSTNQGSPNTPAAARADSATTPTAAAPEEWSLIELNGTLNCTGGANHAATGEGLGGLPLGQLSFPAPDKPILVIGAHKLEGVMVALPKPFLIMRKRKIPHKETVTPGGGKRRMSGGSEATGEETTTPRGKNSNSAGTPGSLGSFGSPMTLTGPSRDEGGEEEGDTEYEVVGMVRQKLLFKERPKPIVSRHLLQR